MEMGNNEVGGVQIGVERRLRQIEPADTAADENRNEAKAEQRRSMETHSSAVNRSSQQQGHDGGRNGDDERRNGKKIGGERIHSADEHVMAPNHVAQEANGDHAADKRAWSQQGLASEHRQNRGNDSDGREDGDVHFGMAEEPEQMLPEQR